MGVNDGCRHPSDPEACAHGGAEPLSDQPQVIRWSLPLNPALPPKQRVCMAFPAEKPLQRKGLSTRGRSEEHTPELQSLMRISYAGFCLKKKNEYAKHTTHPQHVYN